MMSSQDSSRHDPGNGNGLLVSTSFFSSSLSSGTVHLLSLRSFALEIGDIRSGWNLRVHEVHTHTHTHIYIIFTHSHTFTHNCHTPELKQSYHSLTHSYHSH